MKRFNRFSVGAAAAALALWGGVALAQTPGPAMAGTDCGHAAGMTFGQCVAACARMGPNEAAAHCGFANFGQMVAHCRAMHGM